LRFFHRFLRNEGGWMWLDKNQPLRSSRFAVPEDEVGVKALQRELSDLKG